MEQTEIHVFFYKKKVYKKMRLKSSKSEENRKKITRLNFQNLVFLLTKNRYFVVIAFKMLKMEFKIQVYNINNECLTHYIQSISEKAKKKLRKLRLNFGEVKKIEPQAK